MDDGQSNRGLLEEVLERLPDHNLQDRITCSSSPTTSIGGYSDIYIGSFKDDILLGSISSAFCLICRCSKEGLQGQAEVACGRCKSIWDGKLAVKKFRVHVQGRDHFKVRHHCDNKYLLYI